MTGEFLLITMLVTNGHTSPEVKIRFSSFEACKEAASNTVWMIPSNMKQRTTAKITCKKAEAEI